MSLSFMKGELEIYVFNIHFALPTTTIQSVLAYLVTFIGEAIIIILITSPNYGPSNVISFSLMSILL